jgi:hypothetical protein
VEILTLDGRLSWAPPENIRSLPSSVRELIIDCVSLPVTYTALQTLGPKLTKLMFYYYLPIDKTPIDLYIVLAICPKLESFRFLCGKKPVVLTRDSSNTALLPSDYFQNFKRFERALNFSCSLTDIYYILFII